MPVITRKNLNEFVEKYSDTHVVTVPQTEADFDKLASLLDALIDLVGEDEEHPLASLMELIGVLIERYEDEHVPELTELKAEYCETSRV